ncbi:hypothetical protein GTV32_00245 [Gordonia sp. SID5947]|uniref:hypothetical protein n=1 Tax=Gordonia sp. SID5947 TaxID=2690315 RepID=UPI00136C87EB|nr:hypothetical protein [Gordonia sp. SID5947]MYR04862.1 hypothetical protein [Gordonia sp. SID5947]
MTNEHDGQDTQDEDGPRAPRDWRHVYKTRMRTSTAILLVAFLGSVVLYGYTSQRYGVVAPPAPQPARTTQSSTTTTETPKPSSTMRSTSSSTSTAESTTTTEDETGPNGDTGGDQTGQQEGTTTEETVPGLPGVRLPNFGNAPQPGEQSSVPQR